MPLGPVTAERDAGFDVFDADAGVAMGARNAADAALVAVVARCVSEGWWQDVATNSPEHWCRVRLGVSTATSSRLVRVAKELSAYPLVADAFADGQLSIDQTDLIVTTAHPSYDKALAGGAPQWDVGRLRRIIANFPLPKATDDRRPEPAPDDPDPADGEPEPSGERDVFRAGWGDDGRYRGTFDLTPDTGAIFDKAIRAARGALFTTRTGIDDTDDDRDRQPTTVSMPDTLERLLHAALDGLDPETAKGRRPGHRHQVIVHVDVDHPDIAQLHLGPLLPVSVAQQYLCDADLRLAIRRHGRVVALHRRRRTVDDHLRTVVEARDQSCRIPGCERRTFLHIHHLVAWSDGGPTSPDNLLCLCPEHHRMVHRGELRLTGDPDKPDDLLVLDARGRPLPQPNATPPTGPPRPVDPYPGTLRGRMQLSPPTPRSFGDYS